MKETVRYIFIFSFSLFFITSIGQQRFPNAIRPNQFTQGWNKFGYVQSDSGWIPANRDTTFAAKFSGTLIYRQADRKFYYYDTLDLSWHPLTSDSTGSVNDKFNNLPALVVAAASFPVNSILSTKGFYAPNDGGSAQYIITSDTISGLPVDSVSQIRLSNGLFCVLYHMGSIRWEQFGAIGDSVTNDMRHFDKCMNYARHDRTVNTILGSSGKIYRLAKLSTDPDSFEKNCFMRIDFGDVEFDFQGAKVIFDNNANQSYVYYTVNGVTGLYRCKKTNVNRRPTKILYWEQYYWQIMKDSVTLDDAYPTWDSSVTYYGAMNFANLGHPPFMGSLVRNVKWTNMELSGNEPDSIAPLDGYWNINAKAFFDFENIKNVTWYNVRMHSIMSEVIFGGGTTNIGGYVVDNCEIYNSHNAISHGGGMIVQNNLIHDCGANAVESYAGVEKQLYFNNTIYNCSNGITSGGAGTDINRFGDVVISANRVYNCTNYGVFVTRRGRGVSITDNVIYDNIGGNISMYTLSDAFADAVSDVRITGNFIGVYNKNINVGVTLNCASGVDTMRNANIFITNNVFGRLELSYVDNKNKNMSTAIQITGFQYKCFAITNNMIVRGVVHFASYVATNGYVPVMANNVYQRGTADLGVQSVADNDAGTPFSINYSMVREDNMTIGIAPLSSTAFIKMPAIQGPAFVNPDFQEVNFITFNTQRLVFVPGVQDNLKRAVYMYGSGRLLPMKVKIIKSNDATTSSSGSLFYSWSYENNRIDSILSTYLYTVSTSGSLAAGDSVTFSNPGIPFITDGNYDQYSFDSTVANNVAFNPNFQVTLIYAGAAMNFKVKNISGGTLSLGGLNVSVRYYPISNPAKIATYLQPLRSEGLTNMRPVGSDVPNGFVFFDTQLWRFIKWDKRYQTWVDADSPNISTGSVAPVSTPSKVGDVYVDLVNKKIYIATGTSSNSDWTIIN